MKRRSQDSGVVQRLRPLREKILQGVVVAPLQAVSQGAHALLGKPVVKLGVQAQVRRHQDRRLDGEYAEADDQRDLQAEAATRNEAQPALELIFDPHAGYDCCLTWRPKAKGFHKKQPISG